MLKDKDRIFMKGSRKSEDQKAGVGNQTIIDGTGKWKKLIGASCVFGIKYVEQVLFSFSFLIQRLEAHRAFYSASW